MISQVNLPSAVQRIAPDIKFLALVQNGTMHQFKGRNLLPAPRVAMPAARRLRNWRQRHDKGIRPVLLGYRYADSVPNRTRNHLNRRHSRFPFPFVVSFQFASENHPTLPLRQRQYEAFPTQIRTRPSHRLTYYTKFGTPTPPMKRGSFHMVFKLVPSAQTLGFRTAAVSYPPAKQPEGASRRGAAGVQTLKNSSKSLSPQLNGAQEPMISRESGKRLHLSFRKATDAFSS